MYVLSIHDLSKRFGKTQALDHVSLDLEQGRIYGFVGNNGAGKTTLFRCLMGLVTPDSGEITLFGASGKKALEEGRKRTGFLLPRESFSGDMTPRDNLVALQKLRGYTDKDEALRLLERVGIEEDKARRHKLSSLSTGEFQRTAIAATLLGDPAFLIYDEPQNGLDPSGVLDFRQLLLSLKDQGKTIFLSSHNLPELYRLATDYYFLHHGRLIQSISQSDLEEFTATSGSTLEDYFLALTQEQGS
jgi:ABC-2 type transport system ATP-binding protein